MFLKDNFEYYIENDYYTYDTFKSEMDKIKKELLVKNCIYIIVEERTKNKVERISFKISYVDEDARGILFYNSNGEEVFRYNFQRRLGVYYDEQQRDSYQIVKQKSVDYPKEWLEWLVDYAYEDYYYKAQNWFGTGSDLEKVGDNLYMSKSSRGELEKFVLSKKGLI